MRALATSRAIRSVAAQLVVATLVLLTGHVYDRTTGQALAGVTVQAGHAHATTGRDGAFALHVPAGALDLTASSHDVPPQHVHLIVKAPKAAHDLHVCSTTLDFHCGDEKLPESGGAAG